MHSPNDTKATPASIASALANSTLGEMVQAMADISEWHTSRPEW